jgi:glycerophosphoryl diester phosphodiesterase
MQKSLLQNQRPPFSAAKPPLVIAHRGASGLAPENTLTAFNLALAMGAQGIELDIHLSADGQPVVIHDRLINRTTSGTGRVHHFTVAELQKFDAGTWFTRRLTLRPRTRRMVEQVIAANNGWLNSLHRVEKTNSHLKIDFSAARIPTLEQVFRLLAAARLQRIYVELKGEASRKPALLEAALALAGKFRLQKSLTLLSFDHEIIAAAKRLAPEIRTAVTLPAARNALVTSRSIIRAVQRASADEAALHFGLATRRAVAALHEQGLAVSVWTANNKMVMRKLIACEVDAIMTNFPQRLFDLL